MFFAKMLFKGIDVLFDRRQNERFRPDGAERVLVEKDIVYAPENPGVCRLDCYRLPEGKGKYPVLFYIHGGGFLAGDKHHRRTLCRWFAAQGYFVVNVNYGLCPRYIFPEPLRHLVAAFNWMADNAERLGVDMNRAVVGGDSAGAFYGALLSVVCTHPSLQERLALYPKGKFCAAMLNCGLYDVESAFRRTIFLHVDKSLFKAYTGVRLKDVETYEYRDCCSPLPYVDGTFPPCLVIYASKDIFCAGQEKPLFSQLQRAGVPFESYRSDSRVSNHCFSLTWKGEAAKEANARAEAFLGRIRDGKPPVCAAEEEKTVDFSLDNGEEAEYNMAMETERRTV